MSQNVSLKQNVKNKCCYFVKNTYVDKISAKVVLQLGSTFKQHHFVLQHGAENQCGL